MQKKPGEEGAYYIVVWRRRGELGIVREIEHARDDGIWWGGLIQVGGNEID